MPAQPMDDDKLRWALELKRLHGSTSEAARAADVPRTTFQHWEKLAAERGMSGFGPVMPGFAVKTVSSRSADGAWVKQGKEHGPVFEQPETHVLGKITVNRDADGRIIQDWTRYEPDKLAQDAAQKAALEGFKDQIPKAPLVQPPALSMSHMLSQYTVTDAHLGALAWNAETGAGDYDLAIGEKLLVDWFSAAIAGAPPSQKARIEFDSGKLVLHSSGPWQELSEYEFMSLFASCCDAKKALIMWQKYPPATDFTAVAFPPEPPLP